MKTAARAARRGSAIALVMLAAFPAMAMAAGLEITSPSGGSFSSMPTFSGTTNGTLNPVTLSVYAGTATSGTPETTATSIPSGESWSTKPSELAPGTYTAVARENNEVLENPPTVSNSVTFTIVPPTTGPKVLTNPQPASVAANGTATFRASASGNPPPSVQWEVNEGQGWANDTADPGNTSNELSVTATSEKNGNAYRAKFKNEVGTATSNEAALHVPPTVTVSPESRSVNVGGEATFTAAANGHPKPTVQWYASTDHKNYSKVPGATSETLTIAKVSAAQNGTIYVAWFENSGGGVGSAGATLTVNQSAPQVTQNPTPSAYTAAKKETVKFTAAASGAPTPSVQWEESRYGGPWGPVPGATSATLVLHAPGVEGTYRYRARFANELGEAFTEPATLTVTNPSAPAVIVNPLSTTVSAGGTATFTAAATGPPPPTVQWQESNGGSTWTSIPGATEDLLKVAGASASQNGHQFRAVFTNELGYAISSAATLTVTTPPPAPPAPPAASLVPGFSWFPATPHVGEPVTLASTSTDAASPIIGFAWDFAGNGSFAPGGPLVSTSFATPGPHLVRLRASAANGVVREVGQTISVLPRQLNLIQPFPVVRMVGSLTSSGVRISVLTVQAPAGSVVSARCLGRRCPLKLERGYARARAGSTRVPPVTLWRFQRFLRSGVVLQIKVYKAGQVGKYTSFTVRRGRLPVRIDECLDATSLTPMVCPS